MHRWPPAGHPCFGHACDGCSACQAWPASPTCCGAPGGQNQAATARIPLGVDADVISVEPLNGSLADLIARDADQATVATQRLSEQQEHSSQPALGSGPIDLLIADAQPTPTPIKRRD
jgi:hypothetical protein